MLKYAYARFPSMKGQLTVYIILGMIFLGIVGTLLYILFVPEVGIPARITPINDHVQTCLEQVSVPGIYLLARNGGYIFASLASVNTLYGHVAYHHLLERDLSPKQDFMEREISQYIQKALPACIKGFRQYPQFMINASRPSVNVEIQDDFVSIEMDYPLEVSQEGRTVSINEFATVIPIRLGTVLDRKEAVLAKYKQGTIDTEDLEMQLTVMPYDKNTLVFSLYDEASSLDGSAFLFNFATRRTLDANLPPIVQPPGIQQLTADEEFSFQLDVVDPEGDPLNFRDESALFDISPRGEIVFTPSPYDEGIYRVPLTVTDGTNTVSLKLALNITDP